MVFSHYCTHRTHLTRLVFRSLLKMSTAPDPQPSNGTEHPDGEAKRLFWEEFSRKQDSKQRTNNFTDLDL